MHGLTNSSYTEAVLQKKRIQIFMESQKIDAKKVEVCLFVGEGLQSEYGNLLGGGRGERCKVCYNKAELLESWTGLTNWFIESVSLNPIRNWTQTIFKLHMPFPHVPSKKSPLSPLTISHTHINTSNISRNIYKKKSALFSFPNNFQVTMKHFHKQEIGR